MAAIRTPPTQRAAASPGVRRQPEGQAIERIRAGGGFAWAINPYGGCEFGCSHCPARLEGAADPAGWVARQDASPRTAAVSTLVAHLGDVARRQDDSFAAHPVHLGTSCDPWQPAEREAGLTRRILEALAQLRGVELHARTLSSLVGRDGDLLAQIARRGRVEVTVAIPALERRTWLALEPHAPSPERRLMAVGLLARAGIRVGVEVGPLLRGIADTDDAWSRLLLRARDAGAQFATAKPLWLPESARERLVALGTEAEPERAGALRRLYTRAHLHDPSSWRQAEARFQAVAARFGLAPAPERPRSGSRPAVSPRQLPLF